MSWREIIRKILVYFEGNSLRYKTCKNISLKKLLTCEHLIMKPDFYKNRINDEITSF